MKYADWPVPDIPDPLPMIKIDTLSPEVVGAIYYSIDFSKPDLKADQFYSFES